MIKFEANSSGERQMILKSHYQVVKYQHFSIEPPGQWPTQSVLLVYFTFNWKTNSRQINLYWKQSLAADLTRFVV